MLAQSLFGELLPTHEVYCAHEAPNLVQVYAGLSANKTIMNAGQLPDHSNPSLLCE
jgi:hypothetical protein